ncbi:MAG: DNA repair protein RadA [Lachnospiraceae bacterium]|nr:DNA repair protein RadA [Lachnospiraceae bacterium]
MAKAKQTMYFCKECGYESAKWMGQCPACKTWNSMTEAPQTGTAGTSGHGKQTGSGSRPVNLSDVEEDAYERSSTGMKDLDRVLGGGLVRSSFLLVGGDPGIGKSTLLLQLCGNLSGMGRKVLYVSGEESERQIKMRAGRLGITGETSGEGSLKLLCETALLRIEQVLMSERPDVVVIDSIQTMFWEEAASTPGSVSQVRECTAVLLRLAKQEGFTIIIVGHVTKEGVVAGPRMLEHMVDTVLYFEGDKSARYRIVRSVKNRFGATGEIGVFSMQSNGLEEVENPSAYMLEGRPENASGDVVTCSVEGSRAMLLEIQALVYRTAFGMPRRTAIGTDVNRVNLLMAVLEKRAGLTLSDCDAYVNITGGMKLSEPALDLAIVMALASGARNRSLDPKTVVFGEVGLSGEVRGVSAPVKRLQEAVRQGFTSCILPTVSLDAVKSDPEGPELMKKVRVIGVENLDQALTLV